MPNCELHGFDLVFEQDEALNKVIGTLKAAKCADEIVVTTFNNTVVSLGPADYSPFLRVISGDEDREEVVDLLKPLGYDIEVIRLHDWIPKST